jgi:DNA polymerase-3 subunit delta'
MKLANIFSQKKALTIIAGSTAADRVAHAYIFAGPDGVGKFETAKRWAAGLLCQNPQELTIDTTAYPGIDPCCQCQSCKLMLENNHPDFMNIRKELLEFTEGGKNRTTPLDMPKKVIDEFLIETANKKPVMANRKIYVISEAEKVNPSSQNAMLKVLEEPPAHCVIILICSNPETMLPTTRSRCQIVRFGPVQTHIIQEKLIKNGIDQVKAAFYARFFDGSIGQAMMWASLQGADIFDINSNIINRLANIQLSDCLTFANELANNAKNLGQALSDLNPELSKKDMLRRAQKTLILVIIKAIRDAMVSQINRNDDLVNLHLAGDIQKIADRYEPELAAEKVNQASKMINWVDANVNDRLIFEQLLINLVSSDKIASS